MPRVKGFGACRAIRDEDPRGRGRRETWRRGEARNWFGKAGGARLNLMMWRRLAAVFLTGVTAANAWDYEGHRIVSSVALASLPTNFPAFVQEKAARERILFLSGEPDRWRNTPDLGLKHANHPDHYINLDELPRLGLSAAQLSPFRYEFVAQLALARAAGTNASAAIDESNDTDRTKGLVGYLPWTIAEGYSKLKSAFSYLKTFEAHGGTAEEIRNARENVIYLMGVLSHFVGDGAQPLHMTRHYNGWVGENARGFTTNRGFHAWIDGGFAARAGIDGEAVAKRARTARLLTAGEAGVQTNMFEVVMVYLQRQFDLVVPTYELDRAGKLSSQKPAGEGIAFIQQQWKTGGEMLGDLWLTAWHYAPPDTFLRSQLAKRKLREK